MWFDIVAATMGFMGSIIFSAGLIKGKQQILDENTSYFDKNPFTLKAELKSQPFYIIGIAFLIAGFATSIAGSISEIVNDYRLLISILVAISITMLGYFAMAIFYITKNKVHHNNYVAHRKKIFYSSLRSYSGNMYGLDGKDNEKEQFEKNKDKYQSDLLKKAKSIPEPENEIEMNLVEEIDATTAAYQFYMVAKSYLDRESSSK